MEEGVQSEDVVSAKAGVSVSSWPPPPLDQAGDTAPPDAPSPVQAPAALSCPAETAQGVHVGGGWLRYYDHAEDAHYFYHSTTGETRWESPEPAHPDAHIAACPPDHQQESRNAPSAPAGCHSTYHDGYDWDAYARVYGLPSGYHAYWQHYWGAAAGPPQYAHQLSSSPAGASDAAGHAMSVSGSIIYEPARAVDAVGQDAMARLDKILARAAGAEREAVHAAELVQMRQDKEEKVPEAGDDSGLTEAQKIFGTGETFADPTEWRGQKPSVMAAVAHDESTDDPRKLTAADIAASARLLEESAASAHGVSINESDVRRHGLLARQTAIEKTLLMTVENPASASSSSTGGYEGKALFNKRTGKFESAGAVVHRIPINDPRRQTSHFFDYDKWAQEKSANPKSGKRAKISLV